MGQRIKEIADTYGIAPELIIAIAQADSSLGTAGRAVRTKNPGNVGNNDRGDTVNQGSWDN